MNTVNGYTSVVLVVNAPATESKVSISEKIVTRRVNTACNGCIDAKNEF